MRQASNKRSERVCRIKILLAVTKQSLVEVGSIDCHASSILLLATYRMLNHNISNIQDILECLVGPSFAVFYLLRRCVLLDKHGTQFLRVELSVYMLT